MRGGAAPPHPGIYRVPPLPPACRAGVFWREPLALTPPSLINRRAEVWNESIIYPREMETGSKEREGGGEGKSLAYELGSVGGERFCVIINRIVSMYAIKETYSG